MKKKLRSWIFIFLLQLTWIPLYIFWPEAEQKVLEEVIEEEWDIIRWKQEDEFLDVSVEPLELEVQNTEVFTYEKLQDMD